MKDLNNISKKNILVVGDVMIDTYYYGEIKRISPEAPVPVFRKKSDRSVLGGAANVASNLVSAGQNVYMMAIVGNDVNGDKLKGIFHRQGINTDLIISLDRNTTEKVRFLANNNQQVLRLDVEDTIPLDDNDCDELLKCLGDVINSFDLILLSDYLKGLLTLRFTQGIINMARENGIPAIIDVKDPNLEKYKNAYLIKPNLKELHDLTGMPVDNDGEIIAASEMLRKKCNCKYILTTCGARGMVLVGEDKPYFKDAEDREVYDVTGAGDTTIAYLATCMLNGFSMKESVDIANCAAGIQVSKVGTSCVCWREIREYISDRNEGVIHKLISGKAIDDFRKENEGKKIVFTNGCFDIMHVGHLRYLQKAAELGDILVVAINSDASVKRLKGQDRPINSEQDRAEMMCALGFVDYVVIFEEDTPLEIINKIQPDILVKGGDYSNEYVVGTDEVEARGGKLVLLPFVEGKSTSNIINKIQR